MLDVWKGSEYASANTTEVKSFYKKDEQFSHSFFVTLIDVHA